MINITVLLGLLLFFLPRALFAPRSLQRACFLTVTLGFAYWYWLPAIQLLNFPPADVLYSARLTPVALDTAAWQTLLYELLTVFGLVIARPLISERPFTGGGPIDPLALSSAVFVSTVVLLFVRFGSGGFTQIVSIFSGTISARDLMTYYNRSEGLRDSLLALWDVFDVGLAIYLISLSVLQKRLLSFAAFLAVASLVVSFFASGTRSVLLGAIAAGIVGWTLRPASAAGFRPSDRPRSRLRFAYAALLIAAAGGALFGIAARFRFGLGAETNFIVDTVFNNNDMFRETAFVYGNLGDYRPQSTLQETILFSITPFWYMLPSFLGFAKDIPDHLVLFNYERFGIDIVNGEGNVFPGLIGDFQMVFGFAGPVAFAAFIVGFSVLVSAVTRRLRSEALAMAFAIALLSQLFVSFRNIQGSLALLFFLLGVLSWALGRSAARQSI